MSEQAPRTEAVIKAELDKLIESFDREEISDVGAFKSRVSELNTELAEVKNAETLYKMQNHIVAERNLRIFDEVARKHYGISLHEAENNPKGGGPAFNYFKAKLQADGRKLNEMGAKGDDAIREYLEAVADIVNSELGHEPGKKAAAKKGKDDAPAKNQEPKPEGQLANPEPNDISGMPESTEQTVSDENATEGEKAFQKMIRGEEITDLENAFIARDIEFNEASFKDPGLPISEMSALYKNI